MMNQASTPTKQPAAVNPPGKLAHATPTTAPLVAGRRSFFKYRDLGVTAASSGKLRAQVTIGADGMTQPTGWHHDVCEGQFVYMLSGSTSRSPFPRTWAPSPAIRPRAGPSARNAALPAA